MNIQYIKTVLLACTLSFALPTMASIQSTILLEMAAALPALGTAAPFMIPSQTYDFIGNAPASPALEMRLYKIFTDAGIDVGDIDIKQYSPMFAQQVEMRYTFIQNNPASDQLIKEAVALQLFVQIIHKTLFINEQRCATLSDEQLKVYVLSQIGSLTNHGPEKQLAFALIATVGVSLLVEQVLPILAHKIAPLVVLEKFAGNPTWAQSLLKLATKLTLNYQLAKKFNGYITNSNKMATQELLAR